jgi:type I restriction enzyme S subunit
MNNPRVEEPVARYLAALEPPLLQSFDLLACAPKGVARLRELILSLAVRGKLVPQDPNDEPASVLLERIRAEKARLVAGGKIRREKPLVEISEGEKPFGLPAGWEWVRLGEITNYGTTTKAGAIAQTTWVLDLEDIEKGTSRLIRRVRYPERNSLSDKNSFQIGDILYGKLRPYLNKVLVADEAGICTTEIVPFRCYGPCIPQYVLAALQGPSFLQYVVGKSYGMKMPRLGTDDARSALIPLPPFLEQSRIVARVEALMRLCDELEAKGRLEAEQHARLVGTLYETLAASESAHALAENWQRIAEHFDLLLDRPETVDALEQTLLQLAVRGLLVPQDPADEPASALLEKIRAEKHRLIAAGKLKRDKPLPSIAEDEKPFELPERWEWVRFGEVTNISSGVTLGRKTPIKEPVSLPYLRVANVQRGHLVLSVIKEVTIDRSELERFQLQENDLLITEGGDWDKVGRTCIWRGEVAVCLHQNHVFKARAVSTKWNPLWAELYLNSTDARTYFAASAKQTTNLASINMGELKVCLFPLPPLAEQSRIVIRVEQLRHLCADLRARLGEARATQSRLAETLVDTSTV